MSTSLPLPAKFNAIVEDLFQNEVIKTTEGKEFYTFSDLALSEDQQKSLVYPNGFFPINLYILGQVDAYLGKNFTTSISITSFIKNGDGYIYGYYFDITNQPRFEIEVLKKSKEPVTLDPAAQFNPSNYLEVYNNVVGRTTILSLDGVNVPPYATIQYRHKDYYYYELLTPTGINYPQFPPTKLLGLSKNLEKYVKKHKC
jgi:hypothetical protein